MFLGRRRFVQGGPQEGGLVDGAVGGEGLNQTPMMPFGMQRFLSKKGINSPEDLMNRVNANAPRMPFRKAR